MLCTGPYGVPSAVLCTSPSAIHGPARRGVPSGRLLIPPQTGPEIPSAASDAHLVCFQCGPEGVPPAPPGALRESPRSGFSLSRLSPAMVGGSSETSARRRGDAPQPTQPEEVFPVPDSAWPSGGLLSPAVRGFALSSALPCQGSPSAHLSCTLSLGEARSYLPSITSGVGHVMNFLYLPLLFFNTAQRPSNTRVGGSVEVAGKKPTQQTNGSSTTTCTQR